MARPLSQLHALLLSLFGADELRRWISFEGDYEAILAELPGQTAAPALLAEAVITTMQRRALIDADFFQRLVADFPRRAEEINRVAALWPGVRLPDEEPAVERAPRGSATSGKRRASSGAPQEEDSSGDAAYSHSASMPLRVFISYRWESDDHKKAVVAFAQALRRWGFDAWIDLFDTNQPHLWRDWMQRQIDDADFVLIVCSAGYRRSVERFSRANAEKQRDGFGTAWEWRFIAAELIDGAGENRKFIPVILEGSSADDVPRALHGYSRYGIPRGYQALTRRLNDENEVEPVPLGGTPDSAGTDPIPAPPPTITPMPYLKPVSLGAMPPGAPVHALDEWYMLLDRSIAKQRMREILSDERTSHRVVLYGERDQGLDLFRQWLSAHSGSVTSYCAEYSIDGSMAQTVDGWVNRTTRALGAFGKPLVDGLRACTRERRAILVYNVDGPVAVVPAHAEALADMVQERLASALAALERPPHVLVIVPESRDSLWSRIFARSRRERRIREVRGRIQRALEAESLHIEPPTFAEVQSSLEDLVPEIGADDIAACEQAYNRLHGRLRGRPGFRELAEVLHKALAQRSAERNHA